MMYKKTLICMGFVGVIVIHSIGQTAENDSLNAQKGVQSSASGAWFKMGDMRLINNDWGSKSLECETPTTIFIAEDGTFGWEFNRGPCGAATGNSAPDFPEIEFGLHPFGFVKDSATASDTSSTTLLPLQIKDITSANIIVDQMNIELQNPSSWNICFETWFTTKDPVLIDTGECPYAEIMVFWGWQDGRWPCDQEGSLTSAGINYAHCHNSSEWACGWRYIQFRMDNGPQRSFNGTLDVKAVFDWLVANQGVSPDLWVTRFEMGSEIGDNTSGKVTFKNLTFEVNGVSKSPEFYDPTTVRNTSRDIVSLKRNNAIFPAGTTLEIVNMQGARISSQTIPHAKSVTELSKNLPRGLYLMYGIDKKGTRSKKATLVPVY